MAAAFLTVCANDANLANQSLGAESDGAVPAPRGYQLGKLTAPLTQATTVGDAGIVFSAPSAGHAAHVSASTAYGSCATDGVCYEFTSPTIQLADVSINTAITVQGIAGRVTGRLAYVLTWTDVPCSPAGPVNSTGPWTCTLYDILDAGTGRTVYSFDVSN